MQGEFEGLFETDGSAKMFRSGIFRCWLCFSDHSHKGIRRTGADFVHAHNFENLTVRTSTCVDRIFVERDEGENDQCEAVGVEVHDDASGRPAMVRSRKGIILT